MRHDDRIRIQHMIDACQDASEFLSDREQEDLDRDKLLLFAGADR